MEYVLTERQYNLIVEDLGVPESILEAAEDFFDIFSRHIKSIDGNKNEYEFTGNVDITLGSKSKINIYRYTLIVTITELNDYDQFPVIASMGMAQSFVFDSDIMKKRFAPSFVAKFSINFVTGPVWEPEQLYDFFQSHRDQNISSLAHELKHKYDKQIKKTGLLGPEAEYASYTNMVKFGIPVIDNEFIFYLYFTHAVESLVRSTEVASEIRTRKITPEKFRSFLENNKVFKNIVKIKNFTLNDLFSGIKEKMDVVDNIIDNALQGFDSKTMSDNEKIELILKLVYVNLANIKIDAFNSMIQNPYSSLKSILQSLNGNVNPEREKIDKIRDKFYNYVSKYQNNPIDFFKNEINNFQNVGNQVIKKIGKLYHMTTKNVTESIIDWDLHKLIMEKKLGYPKIQTELTPKEGKKLEN